MLLQIYMTINIFLFPELSNSFHTYNLLNKMLKDPISLLGGQARSLETCGMDLKGKEDDTANYEGGKKSIHTINSIFDTISARGRSGTLPWPRIGGGGL